MRAFISILVICICLGCDQSTDLPKVNELEWRNDEKGCSGMRLKQLDAINDDRKLLRGLGEEDITAVLGKPDQQELYKRNQKFFIYSITPHGCLNQPDSIPRKYLSIRFNATGLAKEVIVYTE